MLPVPAEPDVGLLPLQAPEEVQEVTLALDQDSVAVEPDVTVKGPLPPFMRRSTDGTPGGGAVGGGAPADTVTVAVSVAPTNELVQ